MVFIDRPVIVRNDSLIRELARSFKLSRKSIAVKECENLPYKDHPVHKNIYDTTGTVMEHSRGFDAVHLGLKYRLWVPALLLAERVVDKRLRKDVPVELYNANLRIFNDSFERSLEDWGWLFLRNVEGGNRESSRKDWRETARQSSSFRLLRTAKDSALTLALYDTAYREFVNIWMHNVARMMLNEYEGKIVNHYFYTAKNIYDVRYFYLWRQDAANSELRRADG